ncbi:ribosome maturation factor RimM [Rhodohalobacter mucosus]|uniref:Ribosome maturation factor RimM n=1 Tax=Rhodohalobacter mucosus TaxID=2079485 RepID=A0A316TQI9_9BACT|nr:ribosome maturation factor RimM [Rhodohalobacter mucosus]PWN05951.1 16S rRNA processing protein RimM [Rhodohalobacter mucosus]
MKPSADNRFTEIGRLGKAHGLQGEIRFFPNKLFDPGLFDQVSIFYMKNRRSDMVPVRLINYRTENKQKQVLFFVKFDMITTRSDAEEAMDKALYADRSELESVVTEQEGTADADLTGYAVFCNGKRWGEVLDVLDNPAHPILEMRVESGALLVPYVDEYVESADHEEGAIYCKNLNQLI